MNNVAAGFSLRYIRCNNWMLRRLKSAATICGYEIIINTTYSTTTPRTQICKLNCYIFQRVIFKFENFHLI